MNDNNAKDVVIVEALRTPFGAFGGSLRDIPANDLGAMVVREVVSRARLDSGAVELVIMGSTMKPTEISPARSITLLAGLSDETPALTVDRACCSAMTAVGWGARLIEAGLKQVVVAGGMESMSRVPYQILEMRWGNRLGPITIHDPLRIEDPVRHVTMAEDGGSVAAEIGVSREEQDAWAVQSHRRYASALAAGKLKDEIVPLRLRGKKGQEQVLDQDEQFRADVTAEKLATLPTVYGSPTVTAGNAPGLNDGATSVLLMTRQKAEDLELEPLATIVTHAEVAGNPRYIASIPAKAIQQALTQAHLSLEQMALLEINEAFAAMPLVSSKILAGGDNARREELRARLNVNGGAVAIGHPVGASGARIVFTLAYELRRRGGGYGVAGICGAMGQGDAIIVKV